MRASSFETPAYAISAFTRVFDALWASAGSSGRGLRASSKRRRYGICASRSANSTMVLR
jgi:hypothetical protein